MTPKLLLADDSITVQRVIALTFQGEGIDVIAVGDGDQAVDAIARERPQIVLADLSMPGRDGYAVAEYVKRSPELVRTTRVVLLTGSAEPVEEARSRALGIDGVLSKPFEPHVATALVRRLLGEAPILPSAEAPASGPAFETVILEGNGGAVPPPVPADPPTMPHVAAGGSMTGDAIAVDDYFRRLDEALATAGLATAPETAGDLAAIAGLPAEKASADAETLVIPRPVPAPAEPDADDADADAPKLVDAFSALLDAEEGKGVVAGPVEMEGAPAPVPPPAVEWTPGAAAAPVEAAAETVMLQAVEVAEAEQATVEAPAPPDTKPETESEEVPAEAATVLVAGPVAVPASTSPAALKADVAEPSALDGVDLDVFADAVAQKILHRLTDARIDAIVSERVLEIAERLVREEIERIKADAQ